MNGPFQTLAEVREYLSGDKIQCLVCGRLYKRLQFKHLETHSMTADDYRVQFGIPYKYSLTSAPSRALSGDAMTDERILQFKAAKPKRNMNRRPRVPAVANAWKNNSKEGRHISRKIVTTGCATCGIELQTTELTATQPIHCDNCATKDALKVRARYRRRKQRAAQC